MERKGTDSLVFFAFLRAKLIRPEHQPAWQNLQGGANRR
jgi:hypothetical protein